VGCLANRFSPSKGWDLDWMSENSSPKTQLSLVQLAALQSVMSTEVASNIGYLLPL
jgi:hypothetical protein